MGFGPGLFTSPSGIGVSSSGNIYVADFGSPDTAVQEFTNEGTFLRMWGSFGLGDGQFINPGGLTVDSSDSVYVGDFGENNRIQKFDSEGNLLTKWGTPGYWGWTVYQSRLA